MMMKQEDLVLGKKVKFICGIYFLLQDGEVMYVGQSTNIASRVKAHVNSYKRFNFAVYIECEYDKLDELENLYILKYEPRYNVKIGNLITIEKVKEKLKKRTCAYSKLFYVKNIREVMGILNIKHVYFKKKEKILRQDSDKVIEYILNQWGCENDESN